MNLSSAFGSFLLRYDDAANPLIDMPQAYGYYGAGVTDYGLAAAQVDVKVPVGTALILPRKLSAP